MSNLSILDRVGQSKHMKVKVVIVDVDGVLRGKYIHKEKFLSAVKRGFGFCNVVFGWDSSDVCYDNTSYAGWHTGYPDAEVRLDLSTYREIPWENSVPMFLGEFVETENKPLEICPRQVLKKVCSKAEKMGLHPRMGCEYEWFNFCETPASLSAKSFHDPQPITPGMFGYSALRSSLKSEFFHQLMDDLESFQVPLEGLHTETGPGVYEAAIANCSALEQADRAVLFKTGVKEIAYRHNIVASFMARWNTDLPGCSGHIHQSLWDDEKNLFYDGNDPNHMSPLFKNYLAGQIQALPALLPLFAPTVNSYKRLVEGFWAPIRANWGVDNRTVALRVIPGSEKSCRVETRVGGADMNAYLAIAASLASGLYGIEKSLDLKDKAVVGNGYETNAGTRFPTNLDDAAKAFRDSELARELFGHSFVEHFAQTRLWEWKQSQLAVTDWELKRYFEII